MLSSIPDHTTTTTTTTLTYIMAFPADRPGMPLFILFFLFFILGLCGMPNYTICEGNVGFRHHHPQVFVCVHRRLWWRAQREPEMDQKLLCG